MRILMELRTAMQGYAGIPQETRLLYASLPDAARTIEVDGLLNTGQIPYRPRSGEETHVLKRTYQQARYILSLIQEPSFKGRFDRYSYYLNDLKRIVALGVRSILKMESRLIPLDGRLFYDFIWQRLFAMTLPSDILDEIVRRQYYMNEMGWVEMHRIGATTGFYPRIDTSMGLCINANSISRPRLF
jgi:hypothetical protein